MMRLVPTAGLVPAMGLALALAGCNDQFAQDGKASAPIPAATLSLMAEKGMSKTDPILVRLYKKESELEVWKRAPDGQYAKLKTFPICRWSGQLGPKRREGDRQAPEGFYTVTPGLMNPNSSYHLSFDTGFPNAYDRAQGGTGSHLMVHGSCSSRGCYAMTDEGISEVYALAREAFAGGQRGFQLQAMPFRMTAENLARHRLDDNMPFWRNLKEGADHFEVTKTEPKVAVCGGRYAFNTLNGCTPDAALAPAVAAKADEDRRAVAELVEKGTRPVKLVYADGGGHPSFRDATVSFFDARPARSLGDVSRPDALAEGPREIELDTATPARPVALAAAASRPAAASRAAATLASRMVVASADASAAAAGADAPKPFHERVAGAAFKAGEAPLVRAEPAIRPAATVRKVEAPAAKNAASSPATLRPAVPPLKLHAQNAAPAQKRADAGLIPGAQAIAPAATGFRPN